MTDFKHITDWELKAGSHEFPGPDGGTCINEAAIVAAGFKYRSVRTADDLPRCFSLTIGAALMGLNDGFSDATRQRLLCFIPMLAGSRGNPRCEEMRGVHLRRGARKLFAYSERLLRPEVARELGNALYIHHGPYSSYVPSVGRAFHILAHFAGGLSIEPARRVPLSFGAFDEVADASPPEIEVTTVAERLIAAVFEAFAMGPVGAIPEVEALRNLNEARSKPGPAPRGRVTAYEIDPTLQVKSATLTELAAFEAFFKADFNKHVVSGVDLGAPHPPPKAYTVGYGQLVLPWKVPVDA